MIFHESMLFISMSTKTTTSYPADDLTRFRNFFQMRLDRIRNAEISKRNRERLKNPSVFPSVPSGDL